MSEFDLVIRGGTIVTAAETARGDIGVKDGRIVALAERLSGGARTVDAGGRLVMPGGVDSHCHIAQPKRGPTKNADSFETGTASALAGGTTSVICFSPQFRGEGLLDVLAGYEAAAAAGAMIDYSFHIVLTDPSERVMQEELPGLVRRGFRSLKIYMAYDTSALSDVQILKVFALARAEGALVTVHAENHAAIMWLSQRLVETGHTAPRYHPWAKPIAVEREACHRVITLAELTDTPIQVFHVSGSESAAEIERAQARGLKVFGETCPQYLLLDETDLDQPGFEGAKLIFSPAARPKENQEALWRYIRRGVLDVVSSDHAPWVYDSRQGKKAHGDNAPFNQVPNGVPGLETRLPLLFSEGVVKGRIDLHTFVAITATNPARIFGLHPRKGTLAVGADADIALWDPELTKPVRNAELHHAVDYTPYEGMSVTGWPVATFSRGELVWDGRSVLARPGRGRLLLRGPYDHIRPAGMLPTPFDPVAGRMRG